MILPDELDRLPSFLRDFEAAHTGTEPFFTQIAGEPIYRDK